MTNQLIFSGSYLEYPYPGMDATWSDAQIEYASSILDRLGGPPAETVPGADLEDFWENAIRHAASIDAAQHNSLEHRTKTDGEWSQEEMSQRIGPVFIKEEARHSLDRLRAHEILIKHGGRRIEQATYFDMESPDNSDLYLSARRCANRSSAGRAVIKMPERKSGVISLDVIGKIDSEVQTDLSRSDLGYALIRYGDRRHSITVQEWIPMQHEYRMFVVDGRLITGAGCIEEYTPVNRIPGSSPFSPMMREQRGHLVGSPSPISRQRDLLEAYLAFMYKIREDYRDMTVVIDLAWNPDRNEVVVVELNSLPNSGLYASDTEAVYCALATAKDRGYGWFNFKRDRPDPLARFERTTLDALSEIVGEEEMLSDDHVEILTATEELS